MRRPTRTTHFCRHAVLPFHPPPPPPGLTAYLFNFNFEQLADCLYAFTSRPCLLERWLTCAIEFAEFSTLMAYQAYRLCTITSRPMAYRKIQLCLWPTQWKFYRRLLHGPPMPKIKCLFTVLLPAHAIVSMHSPQFYYSCRFLCHVILMVVHQTVERCTTTRVNVPCERDDPNATNPEHPNQCKKRSISKPVIFSVKLWPPKSTY